MFKTYKKITLIKLGFLFLFFSPSFAQENRMHCSQKEVWNFKSFLPEESVLHFKSLVQGKMNPIESFAYALSLRKNTQNPLQKAFAEYWISRSYFQAGLYHIAYSGFQSITQKPMNNQNSIIQIAALECLSRINDEYPSFKITGEIIRPFLQLNQKSTVFYEALVKLILDQPHLNLNETDLQKALESLTGTQHFQWLAHGTQALKKGDTQNAILNFSLYLKTPNQNENLTLFKKNNDFVQLALGRLYHENKKYAPASYHFQKIPKNSNYLTTSLIGFAWAELLQGHYGKAIGTTLQFNTGGLKETYSPEAFMILAMSLNEICQFPSALNAIQLFSDSYKEEYHWLKNWTLKQNPLYSVAIDSLKENTKIPIRISSEWIRTPLFLGRQEEINLIFKENKKISELEADGVKLQQLQAKKIIKDIRMILSDFLRIKKSQNENVDMVLPPSLIARIETTKTELIHYQRIKNAAPLWNQIITSHRKNTESRRALLVQNINMDLKTRAMNMIQEINTISDNIQLIKMEIYNGATHDLVWQNANPDFKEVSKKIESQNKNRPKSSEVWDWGDLSGILKGNEEVWEDEVGAFQASLSNNCDNKEKYLALKQDQLIQNRVPTQIQE